MSVYIIITLFIVFIVIITILIVVISSWLYDGYDATISTISKRISAITNLDMESAEGLQVVNYGIGGQYEPHFDFARNDVCMLLLSVSPTIIFVTYLVILVC